MAGVAAMVIGSVWYTKFLFGGQWMEAAGMSEKDMEDGMEAKLFLLAFIFWLISAYVLAHFIGFLSATNSMLGAQTGFLGWLGFVAPITGIHYLYEGKSWKLYGINVGYSLVSLVVMGAILAVM